MATLGLAFVLLGGTAILLRPNHAASARGDTSPDARKAIAEASRLLSCGDPAAARGILLQVDLEKARSAEGWELAGMLEEIAGNKGSAMKQYTRGLAVRESAILYLHRARLHRQGGEFAPAMSDMDLAEDRAPMDAAISNERLLLMVQAGLADRVSAEIRAHGSGSSGGWIFGLCAIAMQNGEYSEAGKLLGIARESVPQNIFDQMLKDPILVRHMSQPQIAPFYLKNLPD